MVAQDEGGRVDHMVYERERPRDLSIVSRCRVMRSAQNVRHGTVGLDAVGECHLEVVPKTDKDRLPQFDRSIMIWAVDIIRTCYHN